MLESRLIEREYENEMFGIPAPKPLTEYQKWENAMFGGFDTILSWYMPVIVNKARQKEDRRRAPLNLDDLTQVGRFILWRCWQHQTKRSDIDNFDQLAKGALNNEFRSQIGKEFCPKRGRVSPMFFSEIEEFVGGDDDGGSALESVLARSIDPQEDSEGTFHSIVKECCEQLTPELSTLLKIVLEETLDASASEGVEAEDVKKHIARRVDITPGELDGRMRDIRFILAGHRDLLFNPRYRQTMAAIQ